MSCNLNKFTTYAAGQIVEDGGRIMVQLIDPPKDCPDKAFSTHKGRIVVNAEAQPSLQWSIKENRPLIIVPNKSVIQHVPKESSGVLLTVFILLLIGGAIAGIIWFFNRPKQKPRTYEDDYKYRPSPRPTPKRQFTTEAAARAKPSPPPRRSKARAQASTPPSAPVHHTTVIDRGNDGFTNGLVMGHLMSDHHHHDHYIEREPTPRHREPEPYVPPPTPATSPSYSSDDSSKTDWTDTFSSVSDAFSSFSSDGGGSSFDSGSSFSSDGGGSTFGSD